MESVLFQEELNTIKMKQDLMTISMLSVKLSVDGNQYCYLLGEDLQSGIAGFGETPHLAMLDFNESFYIRKTNE